MLAAMFAGMALRMEAANQGQSACLEEVFEGEVRAGQGFQSLIGNGLEVILEARTSGWILRVLPANGPRPVDDYAELATPPYQSVSPLLLSTDFGFRAQDAVGWNPRRFHFASDAEAYRRLLKAYEAYRSTQPPSAAAQAELVKVVGQMSEGELQIVDARITPGTADQTPAAAAVASHFLETAHRLDQPQDGKATPLGRLNSVRFRIRLELPASFPVERGVLAHRHPCEPF